MRWWGALVFLFFVFLGQVRAELVNGGFERIAESKAPIGWTAISDSLQLVVERGDARGGKAAVHVVGNANGVGLISDAVAIQSGAVYVLTGWAQVDSGQAFARVRWLDESRASLGESDLTTEVTSVSWEQMAGTFVAPQKAVLGQVICLASGEKAIFDDVVLRKVSESRSFDLQLEAGYFPGEGERAARVRVIVQDSMGSSDGAVVTFEASGGQIDSWTAVKSGKAEVTLHGQEGQVGGTWVRAHLAGLSAVGYVGDEKAAQLKGLIFDAETGASLAGRVIVADSLGRVLQAGLTAEDGFVADGAFAIGIPPGPVTISAIRGLTQLAPEPQTLDLVAGKEHAVKLPFRSWVDLRSRGWLVGDLLVGPQEIIDAHATGLDWAGLPNNHADDLLHTLVGSSVKNQWGNQWVLGNVGIVGSDRPGFDVHARAHLDRGVAGYVDLFGSSGMTGLPFDVLAGPTFDALNVVDVDAQNMWFALLNRGYRIAGTAFSTDGGFRTYTQVAGDLSSDKLINAIATGQNMMTNGPLLLFSVFAAGPGNQLPAGRKRRATIRAWSAADAQEYLTRIEVVRNAEVVQSWDLDNQPRMHRISVALEDSVDCWYLARCYGSDSSQVALTNPIFFETKDFVSPQPVQAVVRGAIEMADSSLLPDASVRVIDPLGKVVLETVARGGVFQVWAPATSQIRVDVAGYDGVSQRIFDYEGIQEILREFANTPVVVPELKILDQLAEQLQAVDMVFKLERKATRRR